MHFNFCVLARSSNVANPSPICFIKNLIRRKRSGRNIKFFVKCYPGFAHGVYLCFFLLRSPAKWLYRDVLMHAVCFWGQVYLSDEKRKYARGKKKHRPYDEIWTRKPYADPFVCMSAKWTKVCMTIFHPRANAKKIWFLVISTWSLSLKVAKKPIIIALEILIFLPASQNLQVRK